MSNINELAHTRYASISRTKLLHIIFSTKKRQPWITPEIEPTLYSYLNGICNNLKCFPQMIGGYVDHVHVLCLLSKNISLSKLMEQLKSASSKWVHTQHNGRRDFHWQGGYSAFSVHYSQLEVVKEYIAHQHLHHRTVSFEEELCALLRENDMPFDERYLWD